ncbi:MAG: hypothetical protein V7K47_25560 [Nostoc sp.]
MYKFVPPDDGRDAIFDSWLNRELVSVTNNIDLPIQVSDTSSLLTSQNSESVSVSNNIELHIQVSDTHDTPQTLDEAVGGWKGLKLRLQQGLNNAGRFYESLFPR